MQASPTLYLTIGLIAGMLVVGASAAIAAGDEKAYVRPVERQWDGGECHALMVQNLYRATDPTDPLQDGYLKAAQAYEKLSEDGQTC
jgi:hypothetical protein